MTKRSVVEIPLFHALSKVFRLIYALYPRISKHARYTLWRECEQLCLALLKHLIKASHLSEKERYLLLLEMSDELELLKVLIRFAEETHTIDHKQYLTIEVALANVGKMLGGWIKFASPR